LRSALPFRRTLVLPVFATAVLAAGADVDAQVRRGRTEPQAPPWAPVTAGVRGGWEQEQLASGGMLGAEVRIPLIRDGRVELVPSYDAAFLNPQREDQYNVELFFVPGGRRGGVFIGGGFAWRQSVVASFGEEVTTRDQYFGYNITVGGKQPIGLVHLLITIRWTLLNDTAFDPSAATFGLSLPIFGGGPPPGS